MGKKVITCSYEIEDKYLNSDRYSLITPTIYDKEERLFVGHLDEANPSDPDNMNRDTLKGVGIGLGIAVVGYGLYKGSKWCYCKIKQSLTKTPENVVKFDKNRKNKTNSNNDISEQEDVKKKEPV